MSSHLKSVVKWEPVEENIREELAQTEDTVHHPVGQPFCVIFFARAFDGFDSAQSWSIVKELRNMLILQYDKDFCASAPVTRLFALVTEPYYRYKYHKL